MNLNGFVLNHGARKQALDGLAQTFGQIRADREAAAQKQALTQQAAGLAQTFGASPEQATQMVEGAASAGALPQAFQALYEMKLREMAPLTKMQAAQLEDADLNRQASQDTARSEAEYQASRDQVTDARAQRELALKEQRNSIEAAKAARPTQEPMLQVFDEETGQVRYVPRSEAAGKMAPPKTGMEITTGPDGATVVRTGVTGGTGASLTKKGAGRVEDEMLDLSTQMQRLNEIRGSWKRDFSTVQGQIKGGVRKMLDKIDALPSDQAKSLKEYSEFQQDTLANLNRTIKEITGAAMSIPEAKRIKKEVPNLDDGPTAFKAKMDNIDRKMRMAYARLMHIQRNGLSMENFGGIDIDDMPDIMNARGDELEAQGMQPEAIRVALKTEFGI